MAKKDTKQLLFENMEKLNPEFKLQEVQPVAAQVTPGGHQTPGSQQTQQYMSNAYKNIAPQLKLVNNMDKFAPAFKDWFQYLGYTPQAGNITIQRVRRDVEAVMKQMGYK